MAQDKPFKKPSKRSEDLDDAHEQDEHNALQNPQLMASEMAKAFQELARGEQTASALESQLDGIESKIDQLLASVEANSSKQSDEDDIIKSSKSSS